ncbi:tRNA (adenosine(37)-N6)-threonylcarbamoyltransferase complex ATPase subunit type 1 TsaE [Allomuricauda sp. NBRC 101325]|uniref:tRNA (adenosine(37)-N6)-threonylcarbamoyltransferase complex ATPase subunit type 1 TsaE n=1 Tax=Allomuricauda sp. NBRC 101325 TaxID=1113758 RepID=UPI0024A24781|nr:tRNA (adenosine(37)-N6)-threonylcarbamoyltransferase complex ATPase subunit type 1 TsaE [Muricauda sp. NBRC 101325]GLU44821.1 tRNA (adenosine(37)-N6)-threonylcarbamoyltransferase complex ATPase subunit type 1 TsaE [Muricauda sp. NBRC 101325]
MKREFKLNEIDSVAQELIKNATDKVVCFYGDMGVGKTTLIKALVKEIGAVDTANSPTFGLVNEYSNDEDEPIAFHFDFYRLNDEMEALDMGFEDYLNSDAWLFIEWPEKINSLLPANYVGVFLQFIDESTRSIELNIS